MSKNCTLLWHWVFWKLKLETEGEAEAEGSFYAQLQKYLEISCKKTRSRNKKWHLWWQPLIRFAIFCIRCFFVSLSQTKPKRYRRMRSLARSLASRTTKLHGSELRRPWREDKSSTNRSLLYRLIFLETEAGNWRRSWSWRFVLCTAAKISGNFM